MTWGFSWALLLGALLYAALAGLSRTMGFQSVVPQKNTQEVLQDELWIAYYRSIDLILLNLIWFARVVPIITAVPALGALVLRH